MSKMMKQFIYLILLSALPLFASPAETDSIIIKKINLEEAKQRYNAYSAIFIDARAFPRYAKGTVMRALNVPIRRFKRMLKWLPSDKNAPIVIFCDGPKCGLAEKEAVKFVKYGYRNIMVYSGGYPEWEKHSLPVMSAPKPCECGEGYIPDSEPVEVNGVKLYLDKEDESRVDSKWFAPLAKNGKIPDNLHIVDVRPHSKFLKGHLPKAVNVPFEEKSMELNISKLPKDGVIVFTCKHGSISSDAWFSLPEELQERVFVFNADVVCKAQECTVTPK